MKPLPIALALLLTFALGAAHAAPQNRRADARQLLRLAEQGHADIVKAAQASQGRIARSKPEQRPFWQAVDKMDAALRRVRAGMMARDETFFPALEDGSVVLGELRVVWARTGVPDPAVAEGVRILSGSYQLLRTGYGREAVRHRKGRGLTEAERQRFLRIQQAQQRFADLLRELQERAQKRGDEAMLAELRRMAQEAERIAAAQLTLEAYLNALMIGDAQKGEWTANSQYVEPADRTEWQEADTVVEELYTEEEVGHVFMLDLGNVGETAAAAEPLAVTYFEEPVEVPESLASAVQVFDTPEIDLIEEEESLFEEEMEEVAETDLDVYEEVVEEPEIEAAAEEEEEAVEEEAVEKEGVEDGEVAEAAEGEIVVEELPAEEKKGEVKVESKAGKKAGTPAAAPETAAPKKKEPAPAPAKKDSKKKSAKPPA